MQIKELKEAIPFYFKANLVPLIWGKHGIGKSTVVKQWCEENGYKMIDVRLGQLSDSGDFTGLPDFVTDNNGNKIATKFMQPNWLPRTPKHVIFLDEINRASKDIMQAVFQLILDKRVGEYKLPEDCYIIAAGNPPNDQYETFDMVQTDKALQDRFVHLLLKPSSDEFLTYQKEKGMNNTLSAFLSENSNSLLNTATDFSFDFITGSNRTWEAVDRLEKQNMPEHLLKESLYGMIGIEFAQLYIQYKNDNLTKLSGKDVLYSWKKTKKQVQKYSNVDNNRNDVLKITCDEIENIVKEFKTEQEFVEVMEPLVEFMEIIPKDLTKALLTKLSLIQNIDEPDISFFYILNTKFNKLEEKLIEILE